MTIEVGMVKDGKTIDKEKSRVGETIKGFSKIEMDNPIEMGIIEMKEIDKLGI
jgi:CxxC motif-containing protein